MRGKAPSLEAELCPCPISAGEYIALYQNQRAMLKERHREKEEYISRLAQDKEEMKVGPLDPASQGTGHGQGHGGAE